MSGPEAGAGIGRPGFWGRLAPVLPYLTTLALFVAGLAALYHLLAEVTLADIRHQARQIPPAHLLASLLATAVGYVAMAGYDGTALRYIGRALPARMVALGGFLAYSIGNTIGLSAVSGGAVRYRVYAVLGLGLGDIARISGFVALAYGAGAMLVGLGALIIWPAVPAGLLSLPAGLVRALALAGFVLANLLIWGAGWRRARLRLGRWSVRAPAPGLMGLQLAITLTEMVMGALVLHLLLAGADLPFLPFLALYLMATVAGLASHVPGGVGVFEAVILAALPAAIPKADAAAALLLYRLIYYILPFVLALVLLALLEARGWLTGQVTAMVRALTMGLVPLAMGAMVMGSGVLMMLAPLLPAAVDLAEDAEAALPLAFVGGGALLSMLLGAVLVLIAQGLLRRLAGAWWLTMAALALGMAAALVDGFDLDRAAVLALALLVLLPCRGAFYRSTRLTVRPWSPGWLLLVAVLPGSILLVLFLAGQAAQYPDAAAGRFAGDAGVPPGLRLGMTFAAVVVLAAVLQALRRAPLPAYGGGPAGRARVEAILARWGGPGDAQALSDGRDWLLAEGGDAFIAYVAQGKSWVVPGDPIGDPAQIPGLIWAFRDAARRAHRVPVYFAVTPRWLAQWIETGMMAYRLGEAAIIDLQRFSLDGAGLADLRAAHAAGGQAGLRFELLASDAAAPVLAGLQTGGAGWQAAGFGRGDSLAIGGGDPGWLNRHPVALVRHRGRIAGFAVILHDAAARHAAVARLRHDPRILAPVRAFLLVEAARALAGQGVASLDLGIVPPAGLRDAPGLAGRIGRLIHRAGGQGEGIEAARRLREQFAPDWQMRYLVLPRLTDRARVLGDLIRLLSGPARRPDPAQRPGPTGPGDGAGR